jgi:hypothetical protein
VTPRRRTAILASLSFGTALTLVPAVYLGYQATIGSNAPDTLCVAGRTRDVMPAGATGYSTTQKWTWWTPRYVFTCAYEMRDGSTLLRPPPK